MKKFLCLWFVLALGASSARAEEQRKIPLVEVGLVLPVSVREEESPSSVGGGEAGATNAALSMRVDLSVIGPLLESYASMGNFRIGDFVGFDLGISQQGNLAGRVLAGLQASYEINHQVGVGARVYYVNTFEDLLPGAFGSHFIKSRMFEASGRFGGVIVRGRIGENQRLLGTVGNVGFSLRIPTGWKIIDYKGWLVGVDYDRFTNPDRGPDQISAYTIHRISGVLVLGF